MTTTVREARPEEAADVAALVRDGYLAYDAAVPPDLLHSWIDDVVDAGGGVTVVALVDGMLAGTARLHLDGTYPLPLPGGSAGVRAVVVAPSHRRAGVGSVLMAACAERAWTCGATALYLHTAPFMTAAAALYDGLGYRRDPAVDAGYRDAGQRILLLDGLLHPVFTHIAQTGRERVAHRTGGMRLRDRDDGDGVAAPCPAQAAVDRLADSRQPVNQVMGCHNL